MDSDSTLVLRAILQEPFSDQDPPPYLDEGFQEAGDMAQKMGARILEFLQKDRVAAMKL
jgi:hypothetical protein